MYYMDWRVLLAEAKMQNSEFAQIPLQHSPDDERLTARLI
jgi:hypothetical protein